MLDKEPKLYFKKTITANIVLFLLFLITFEIFLKKENYLIYFFQAVSQTILSRFKEQSKKKNHISPIRDHVFSYLSQKTASYFIVPVPI